jgi:acetoin utilization deacetylase AcuC-like enzyme
MIPYPPLLIAWDPIYAHPLPAGHRFPMLKYELIPQQLLYEGTIQPQHLFHPIACPWEVIAHTHSRDYIDKLQHQTLSAREQRHIGFPQSPTLTQRELIITQGTLEAARFALAHRSIGMNIAGGTHHAFAERGEGFCLLNDFAVAANQLLLENAVQRILIVDLDVHQGNGTAKLFENKPAVFTFSMHGQHNYPFHKEQSDLDIPLADGTDDTTYLQLLEHHLPILLDNHKPDLVFYLAGVDILETDKFGKLKLSLQGSRQRDFFVLNACKQVGIPVCIAMGGGYSADVNIIVEAHCQTFRIAMDLCT